MTNPLTIVLGLKHCFQTVFGPDMDARFTARTDLEGQARRRVKSLEELQSPVPCLSLSASRIFLSSVLLVFILPSLAMLFRSGALLAALALAANAQSTDAQPSDAIEPPNFNVTTALFDLGVNVTDLPAADLVERSSDAACSLAVSRNSLH